MSLNRINGFQLRGFLLLFIFCSAVFCARGADVLFYGLGKGYNFQQTSASTAVDDPAGAVKYLLTRGGKRTLRPYVDMREQFGFSAEIVDAPPHH